MRVKDTLNLGKTKFKMRGNLPVREAQWQKEWEENKLYESIIYSLTEIDNIEKIN